MPFTDAVAIEYKDIRIPFLEVNSREQWRNFFKHLDNGTYVLIHDTDYWHKTRGRTRPENRCFLQDRIVRRLKSWDGAKVIGRHDSRKRLWVTITLPEHYCMTCGTRTKPYRRECQSCQMLQYHREKPFYTNRTPVEIEIFTHDIERAYRQFRMINRKERLVILHLDCGTPDRCHHIRYYFNRYRKTLPKRTSKVIGNQTEVVQI